MVMHGSCVFVQESAKAVEPGWLDGGQAAAATAYVSMTSLLPHTVAQPTKWRFLPKNLSHLVIFVIELTFT